MEDLVTARRRTAQRAAARPRRLSAPHEMPSTAAVAVPSILLVGAGAFGREHLKTWLALQAEGRARLAGVVVASEAGAAAVRRDFPSVAVHAGLDEARLHGVDGVDIAAPTSQHEALVAACLPHADVLCEKPLARSAAAAQRLYRLAGRHGKRLAVCHNYLRHPVVEALLGELGATAAPPTSLRITLTNPTAAFRDGACPFEEWLHAFYLLHAFTPSRVRALIAVRTAKAAEVDVAMAGGPLARLSIGWAGAERRRRIELQWPDRLLRADLDDGQILEQRRGASERRLYGRGAVSLGAVLGDFAAGLRTRRGASDTARAAAEQAAVLSALRLMARSRDAAAPAEPDAAPAAPAAAPRHAAPAAPATRRAAPRRDRPRVLVVGGGIFGATCALELARDNDVLIAERHDRLLTEASWLNQWRHHSGFHYPRSLETIEEVRASKAEFESVYEDTIARDVDAYYAVSALGSEISRERYLAVCDLHGLRYRVVDPPRDIVHPEKLRVCLLTDEAVVRIDRLSARLLDGLRSSPAIDLRLATRAAGGRLLADGRKSVQLRGPGGVETQVFDFVVNATYAGTNEIAHWFGFPLRPMRFDLLEMAVFEIDDAPRFMMTIIDGPFTSLTHTGQGNRFMLSHIHQSILATQVTADGRPPRWSSPRSNFDGLLAHGRRYLPILDRARFVESRIGVRTVDAFSEDFDGRPTVVTAHGFGCWSVLGGKIITAVTNAREIVGAVAAAGGRAR